MSTNDTGRADARVRATRRLHNLTIGTTLLGVAATGALSGIAAVTYDGSTAAGSTGGTSTALVTTPDASTATDQSSPGATATTSSAGSSSSSASAPTITSVQGGAQASTGGS